MAITRYLADTSVWARMHKSAVRDVVAPWIQRGLIQTCGILDAELLYSVRSGSEHALGREHRRALEWVSMPDGIWDRVLEVQGLLSEQGQHRALSVVDLAVAATAERHGSTVLHYDSDYDLVANITNQPTQWVLPQGEFD